MNYSDKCYVKILFSPSSISHAVRALGILIFFSMFIAGCIDHQMITPQAQNGVLDLTGWDLKRDGSLNLNGEWEFYWQKLLDPDDFPISENQKMTGFFTVPGIWNNFELGDQPLPGDGFATFRLKVKMSPDEAIKAIRLTNLSTAYVLYINDKKIAQNGVVGTSSDTVVPQFLLQDTPFHDSNEVLSVVLQVANFNHWRGGITHPILLGNAENLGASYKIKSFFDIAFLGALFLMGVYYLTIYSLYTEDRSPLFLAIVAFNFATRIMVTDNYYLTQLLPDMSWELLYKIELSTIIVGPTALLLFITSLFGKNKKLYVPYLLIVLNLVVLIIVLIAPGQVSSHFVKPSQILILSIFVYCFYFLIRALRENPRKAGIMLLGLSLLFATILIDILSANQIIYLSFIVEVGVLCLILSQSLVLSLRFSDAFKRVKMLSTELKEKNIELQRLDKLKDEFLANTTHELRTPLNGMVGMAESLMNELGGKFSAAVNNNLQTIIASGKRLSSLINDVMDISRLKNRDITLHCGPVDLRAMTNIVFSVLRPLVGNKLLELINDVSADIESIHGDEDRLQQILYNLVGNAIKFTDRGAIAVSASVSGTFVRVSVTDTGIGIAPDLLKDIFAPHEQGNIVLKSGYGGTGLGLTIVEKLVALHGGSISVTSTLGKGSCFTFTMPVSDRKSSVAENQVKTFLTPPSLNESLEITHNNKEILDNNLDSTSVLVVDDDPVNLQVVANHLSTASISFAMASDGLEALSMIKKHGAPSMILLDVMMPKIDGYEVCRQLREDFSPADLPIVFLTARNSMEDLVEGFEVGGNDYLTKPFSYDELLARVETQLKIKHAYATMQENLRLKREVDQRLQTEHALRITQRRLTRILDNINEAVLAVNESQEISFVNEPFEIMTGCQSETLLGKPISSILEHAKNIDHLLADILKENQTRWSPEAIYDVSFSFPQHSTLPLTLEVAILEIENEKLIMLVVCEDQVEQEEEKPDETQHNAIAAIKELNQNLGRLHNLENSLNYLTLNDLDKNATLSKKIQSIDYALVNLTRGLDIDMEMHEKRMMAVTLMNDVVNYWQSATGTDKASLARKSGLWQVYMDYNGWERTQTLDKYLDIKKLPNRPRWKQITRTADFVLTDCSLMSPLRERIESNLRHMLVLV